MRSLSWEYLEEWVFHSPVDRPPPVFQLQTPHQAAERYSQTDVLSQFRGLGGRGRLVEESGVIEFDLDVSIDDIDHGYLEEILLSACREVDERAFVVNINQEADERAVVILEITSRIVEEDLDVIGPGGVLTLSRRGRYLSGDLVVRRRIDLLGYGVWRSPSEIAQRAHTLRVGSDAELLVDFGYFEASKYEPQALMRPAYLFVIDQPQPEELGAGWRTVLVEPATSVPDVSPWEGLENWFEE